jgi:hypothetical protein
MFRNVSKRLSPTWLSLGVAVLTFAGLASLGESAARALGGPRIESIYQNGNNVIVRYYIPDNTPGFSRVHTRWNGPGSTSTNEHQQDFRLGFSSHFKYTIPNIQSHQRYVFKIQGYAGSWSPWHEHSFKTKGITYQGYLYERK